MQLNDLKHPALTLSASLDGYRVEIDPARQRADIVLCRPPFNVISMTQREQLRITFEALDANDDVRVIVLRAEGEHFSSGGNIKGFLEASPEHVSKLAWNVSPAPTVSMTFTFTVGTLTEPRAVKLVAPSPPRVTTTHSVPAAKASEAKSSALRPE